MNVAIRVDASNQIGTGHLMRCMALADALKERGSQIIFISRHLPEHLQNILAAKEHQFMLINDGPSETIQGDLVHSHWLGTSQQTDAQVSVQALSDQVWDWLVVDHYALDIHWESALRQTARHILVIDDIADREHDCDILLDQNYYADMNTRYQDKTPEHCQLLLGPHYALLREEFRRLREQVVPRAGSIKCVLVFFGGIDSANHTGRTIETLANLDVEGIHVDVVIGGHHPYRRQIETACAELQFDCHVQTNRMAELMAAADVSIGAGGSATWERCCLGLPALTVSIADNQVEIVRGLEMLGAGQYIKAQRFACDASFQKAILNLLKNSKQVELLSEKAYSMVDGLGVYRLCEAMAC